MYIRELAQLTARRSNITTKECSAILNNFFTIVHDLILTGEEVCLPKLGKFKFSCTNGQFNKLTRSYIPPHPRVRFAVNGILKQEVRELPCEIVNVAPEPESDDES